MASLEKVAAEIKQRDNFLIIGHEDPDGDCIGSMVGLKILLDKMGKKTRLIFHDFTFSRFDFMFEPLFSGKRKTADIFSVKDDFCLFSEINYEVMNFKQINDDQTWNIIALDSGSRERLGEKGSQLSQKLEVINLDHHPDNPGYGDINYVQPEAAAVGEIIFDLAKWLKIEIDMRAGTALAVALISDTGSLRYKNTSARVLRILAELVDYGVNIYQINKNLYGSYKLSTLQLQGRALSELNTTEKGDIAWLVVDKDIFQNTKTEPNDASGLVNYARDIKGVKVGIAFIEDYQSGEVKISFRSNTDQIPVNEIASHFDGGGHARAAGCSVEGELSKIVENVLSEVKRFVSV